MARLSTMYYRDLRDHLAALEQSGRLRRVKRPIDKDTELHPLVRLQFRGLPASERTGWLFEQVVDARGRTFEMPVAVGCLAASPEIYALGLQCRVDEIGGRWDEALRHPIAPATVESGACQEVAHVGKRLLEHGGLDELPIPISTPGFDNAPYLTAAHVITRDPVSGQRNVGNYRCMLKAPDRLGVLATPPRSDGSRHWLRARKLGKPLDVAIAIGTAPNVSYAAASRIPSDLDELAVAGGLVGQPVELVRCLTVDLEVPATAEIVIEGTISTDAFEMEGSFGEFTGYMANRGPMMFVQVTAIAHRRHPIFTSFISQYPPSESTVLRSVGREATIQRFLVEQHRLAGVLEVALVEQVGAYALLVVRVDQQRGARPRDVLQALAASGRLLSKVVVVVDEDIRARDLGHVWHAIGYRAQAPRDIFTVPMSPNPLDPSLAPPGRRGRGVSGGALMIDATRKWPYPPLSLPKRSFMDRARELWQELDLPDLSLQEPWHGYELDGWSAEEAEEADLAVEGRSYETGAKFARQRVKPPEY